MELTDGRSRLSFQRKVAKIIYVWRALPGCSLYALKVCLADWIRERTTSASPSHALGFWDDLIHLSNSGHSSFSGGVTSCRTIVSRVEHVVRHLASPEKSIMRIPNGPLFACQVRVQTHGDPNPGDLRGFFLGPLLTSTSIHASMLRRRLTA